MLAAGPKSGGKFELTNDDPPCSRKTESQPQNGRGLNGALKEQRRDWGERRQFRTGRSQRRAVTRRSAVEGRVSAVR